MGRKVTQGEVKDWVALHKKGHTYRDIGEKYGHHPKTVGRHIREYLENHPTESVEKVGGKLRDEVKPLTMGREKHVPLRPITRPITEKMKQLARGMVLQGAMKVKPCYEKKSIPELLEIYKYQANIHAFGCVSGRDDVEMFAVRGILLERGLKEALNKIDNQMEKDFREYDLARSRGEVS